MVSGDARYLVTEGVSLLDSFRVQREAVPASEVDGGVQTAEDLQATERVFDASPEMIADGVAWHGSHGSVCYLR